jgi:hypothetical protein
MVHNAGNMLEIAIKTIFMNVPVLAVMEVVEMLPEEEGKIESYGAI